MHWPPTVVDQDSPSFYQTGRRVVGPSTAYARSLSAATVRMSNKSVSFAIGRAHFVSSELTPSRAMVPERTYWLGVAVSSFLPNTSYNTLWYQFWG